MGLALVLFAPILLLEELKMGPKAMYLDALSCELVHLFRWEDELDIPVFLVMAYFFYYCLIDRL